LVWYELLTFFLTYRAGMIGLFLRQKLYRKLFRSLGPKVAFGNGISLKQPGKISIGRGCIIDDQVNLSVRGSAEAGISIQDSAYIGRNTELKAREGKISIGEQSSIGSNCRIATNEGQIAIGREVFIAAFCYIGGGNHRFDRTDISIVRQGSQSKGGVTIGDDVWIGSNCVIADGVSIGKGAIIGSCSYVNKNIPAYAIAFGSPATVRRTRLTTEKPLGEAEIIDP
jgi:acetyltransferase-like isoleucine patch superfamily enzyme